MLQSLLAKHKKKNLDVQIWDCDPLVIVLNDVDVAYAYHTDVEFTPFDSKECIGHAVALKPDPDRLRPEISINSRTTVVRADGWRLGARQGLILTGVDQFDEPVTWHINSAADQFLITPITDDVPFDEENEAVLREELDGKAEKLDITAIR